jgi:hypothetical protein
VRARADRDATLDKPLSKYLAASARLELVVILPVFGDPQGRVPMQYLRELFREEKLPEGWHRPTATVGLVKAIRLSQKMKDALDAKNVVAPNKVA